MATKEARINDALTILSHLELPSAQLNDRSALCLLALLDLSPEKAWSAASAPLMGITPIMDWARRHFDRSYAPNTRETFRRQTMHQFVDAGIALYNPDNPGRPVNSPNAVYQIEPGCLALIRAFKANDHSRISEEYKLQLPAYLATRETLTQKNAMHRDMKMIPINLGEGLNISLSPGAHSELIKGIVEQFGPRFVPGGKLIYAGDTGDKWGYFDEALLESLGVKIDNHGKMPDVVIYYPELGWLILAEAVTSHGPVDAKRHRELQTLFVKSNAGLVFVSAFPDRRIFTKYLETISWETEVWIADNPSHLIHFNGSRFLGPYKKD
jgi:hypothetical protein